MIADSRFPWLCALFLALLSSCTTFHDVRFAPAPLEVAIEDSSQPELSGRALVSVTGLRRADSSAGRPAQFELALRLENLGRMPFALDHARLELVTANLKACSCVPPSPAQPGQIEPGESAQYELVFPLPPGTAVGDLDLSGLNLRLPFSTAERQLTIGASFERVQPFNRWGYSYDDYFWGPRWHLGVGVGVGRFCAY